MGWVLASGPVKRCRRAVRGSEQKTSPEHASLRGAAARREGGTSRWCSPPDASLGGAAGMAGTAGHRGNSPRAGGVHRRAPRAARAFVTCFSGASSELACSAMYWFVDFPRPQPSPQRPSKRTSRPFGNCRAQRQSPRGSRVMRAEVPLARSNGGAAALRVLKGVRLRG